MRIHPAILAVGVCAFAAGVSSSARAETATYTLDPTHSFVGFEVLHFGTSTLRGRYGPLNGEVMLDRDGRRGRVQVVVDTAGVSTGLPVLDARLKQPDLLAVQEHPKAYFVAERFEFDAAGQVLAVRGEFTLRGQSQPLELKAERFNCYTNPLFKREVCGGDFTGELLRSRFGMDFGLPLVADRVRLVVQVEALRQSP
jgi:polyisoprenoid-binding protein YceI